MIKDACETGRFFRFYLNLEIIFKTYVFDERLLGYKFHSVFESYINVVIIAIVFLRVFTHLIVNGLSS